MNHRAVAACLLVLVSPFAMAGQRATAPARAEDAQAARARLDATHREVTAQDASVKRLKARVDTLESNSDAAAKALAERDRKIAELEKQLAAEQRPR